MPVRVRVRFRTLKGREPGVTLETVGVVNTGFMTESPEVVVPIRLAERLGVWPELPGGSRVELYHTAGGATRVYSVPGFLELQVLAGDRNSPTVTCNAAISEFEDELLISDMAAEALGIAIESPGAGLWRFRDESPDRVRRSEEPILW